MSWMKKLLGIDNRDNLGNISLKSDEDICPKCGNRKFSYDTYWKESCCQQCGWTVSGNKASKSKQVQATSASRTSGKILISDLNKRSTIKKSHPLTDSTNLNDIEFTSEFTHALNLIQSGQPLVFITGKAGTGKSTFIDLIRLKIRKNVVVLAPTGVAALNAQGQTIHSFFHFPPTAVDLSAVKQVYNCKLYEKMDILVVDEVSMMRADLFDAIEKFLRLNARDASKLFGGVQVVLIGDMFQLPPVVSRTEEAKLFGSKYLSPYFFSAKSIQEAPLGFIEFTRIFRQADEYFANILNKIREAIDTTKVVEEINNNCFATAPLESTPLILTCTNAVASQINTHRLNKLEGVEHLFEGEIKGSFQIQKEKLPSPFMLKLKIGSQVMFTKNDSEKRWVNGTVGLVKNISSDIIKVSISTKAKSYIYDVQRVTWDSLAYEYDEIKDKIVTKIIGEYKQFPLMLAWAVTIHKSQGRTLESIVVDLGKGAFAHGQVYVALSRCRTLEGIKLERPIRPKDIICDKRIIDFHSALRDNQKNNRVRS